MSRTPRIRYLRYRTLDRQRHGRVLNTFLNEQAERLEVEVPIIFGLLEAGMTAQQIADIPDEGPVPEFPVNTVAPEITGTTEVGGDLTLDTGTWTGAPDLTWELHKDGVSVGSELVTYTIVEGDVGAMFELVVTGTTILGSAVAVSEAVGPVTEPA